MSGTKLDRFFLTDKSFIILMGLIGGGVILAMYSYINYGIGALTDVYVAQTIDVGTSTGDFSQATAFGFAYLFARVLEGPLVGILDIGGAVMTGIGVGMTGMMLSSGFTAWLNFAPFAYLIGFIIGAIEGTIIIVVKHLKPSNTASLGTDVMIGAGNSTGKWLGPLIVFYAVLYNPLTGIGAALGGVYFYQKDKPITGGAILGAMIVGGFTLMIVGG